MTAIPVDYWLVIRRFGQPSRGPRYYDVWVVCCVTFFAFLHSAELTVSSSSSYSKWDQFKQGVSVCVGLTNESIFLIVAILVYSALRGRGPGIFRIDLL